MIEVGQFVRVKGYIGKVCNINEFREPSMEIGIDIPQANDIVFCGREDITKTSDNIIDLIKVGDVIAIKELSGDISKYEIEDFNLKNIYGEKTSKKVLGIFIDNRYKTLQEIEPIIETVLTKERFEANSYKVGERNGMDS